MEVTLNFTDQKKLGSRNFDVELGFTGAHPSISLIKVDLEEFQFPSNACLLLEVFKKTKKTRIDAGTVANPQLFSGYLLDAFDIDEQFNIRARVVSRDPENYGLVLGLADRLKPPSSISDHATKPLLRVRRTDTGNLVWRFAVDGDEPILEVSKSLGSSDDFLRSTAFTALVLPEFVRRVAEWTITQTALHSEGQHLSDWIQYLSLLGCDVDALDTVSQRGNVDHHERDDWALQCADRFAAHSNYLNSIRDLLQEEGQL